MLVGAQKPNIIEIADFYLMYFIFMSGLADIPQSVRAKSYSI